MDLMIIYQAAVKVMVSAIASLVLSLLLLQVARFIYRACCPNMYFRSVREVRKFFAR